MPQPSKAEWDDFKTNLSGRWGQAHLVCDGFDITINIEVNNKRALHYVVYVNGEIKGKWIKCVKENAINDLPEESLRFYMHHKKGYPRKVMKLEEKIFGKRECKKKGIYLKQVVPMPYWKSLNSMICHFKKFNQDIEILSREDAQQRLESLTN